MKKLFIFMLFGFASICHADSTTPRLGLIIPTLGSPDWGRKVSANFQLIDAQVATSTGTNGYALQPATVTILAAQGILASTLTVQNNLNVYIPACSSLIKLLSENTQPTISFRDDADTFYEIGQIDSDELRFLDRGTVAAQFIRGGLYIGPYDGAYFGSPRLKIAGTTQVSTLTISGLPSDGYLYSTGGLISTAAAPSGGGGGYSLEPATVSIRGLLDITANGTVGSNSGLFNLNGTTVTFTTPPTDTVDRLFLLNNNQVTFPAAVTDGARKNQYNLFTASNVFSSTSGITVDKISGYTVNTSSIDFNPGGSGGVAIWADGVNVAQFYKTGGFGAINGSATSMLMGAYASRGLTSALPGKYLMYEASANGSEYVMWKAPASLTKVSEFELRADTDTAGYLHVNVGGIIDVQTPPGGASSTPLAVATGSASGFSVPSSSPTYAIVLSSTQYNAVLLGGGTVFITINLSSITAKGNATNGANQLVLLDSSGRYPAIDGSQITGIAAGSSLYSATSTASFPFGMTVSSIGFVSAGVAGQTMYWSTETFILADTALPTTSTQPAPGFMFQMKANTTYWADITFLYGVNSTSGFKLAGSASQSDTTFRLDIDGAGASVTAPRNGDRIDVNNTVNTNPIATYSSNNHIVRVTGTIICTTAGSFSLCGVPLSAGGTHNIVQGSRFYAREIH